MENKTDCCSPKNNSDKNGTLSGIVLGLFPHAFCIGFVVFSVIGATVFAAIFKNLLMIPYFFHLLVVISLVFATISAAIYLKRKNCLSIAGIKVRWKYLTVLYSITVLVNLSMFFVVFPVLANIDYNKITEQQAGLKDLSLVVEIPCSGHSFLIISELKKVNGVSDVKFKMPNIFEIKYNPNLASVEKIISLDVFKTYKATIQE